MPQCGTCLKTSQCIDSGYEDINIEATMQQKSVVALILSNINLHSNCVAFDA